MKFYLTDRVLELETGKRIVAVKNLSLAEEYLQDHFPSYPVLPGVLMFEAMIQAAAWLQRVTTDFAQSMVVLQEARNVKYGAFFKPGTQMVVTVDLVKHESDGLWRFKGIGKTDEQTNVQGRFTLQALNLADDDPGLAETDSRIVAALRRRWALIAPHRAAAASQ
ncbi:MAG: beta-hydroxyacyl-ACP dehydratase [Anaerolineaceae bacterium]|nr:beta-hydroxyacyl-ACP dehydratase [Anaerolineaceae bacterium]